MELMRNVVSLADYDEEKHLDVTKRGEIEEYENEYHLMRHSLGLPTQFMELSVLEQRMVLLFVDKDYIEPNSRKHTENNSFISFLAAFEKKEVVEKIYMVNQKVTGHDKFGNQLIEEIIMVNPTYMSLYMKLKTHATMIWKNANLKEIAKSMREIITNNGYRDEELLEQRILSDSLSTERDSFTMQNRRVAVEIKGMKKPVSLQQINVYLDAGGNKANEEIVKTTNNDVYDLIPKVEKNE